MEAAAGQRNRGNHMGFFERMGATQIRSVLVGPGASMVRIPGRRIPPLKKTPWTLQFQSGVLDPNPTLSIGPDWVSNPWKSTYSWIFQWCQIYAVPSIKPAKRLKFGTVGGSRFVSIKPQDL